MSGEISEYSDAVAVNIKEEPAVEYLLILPFDERELSANDETANEKLNEDRESCKFCDQKLRKLTRHYSSGTKCPICQVVFKCNGLRNAHLKVNHVKKLKCNDCSYVATQKISIIIKKPTRNQNRVKHVTKGFL